jgi:hypothetical protein
VRLGTDVGSAFGITKIRPMAIEITRNLVVRLPNLSKETFYHLHHPFSVVSSFWLSFFVVCVIVKTGIDL